MVAAEAAPPARERDEQAIMHWKTITFPDILQAAADRDAHIVFLDESGFMLTPTVRRTWAPQGQTPLLSCWDRRDRLSAISCITVSPQRARLNFYFELLPDNANATAEDIVAFLRQLRQQLASPFTVIWDGSPLHSRSRLVRAYLADHPEIVAETLPGYAPELNPDEGVWGWTKYGAWPTWLRPTLASFGVESTQSSPSCETIATCWTPSSKRPTCVLQRDVQNCLWPRRRQ